MGSSSATEADGGGRMELACAADHDYVPHTAAMLHSVLAGEKRRLSVRVHFLHGPDLPASDRQALAGMVGRLGGAIEFHPIADEQVSGLRTRSMRPSIWYRVFLPRLLPGVERVLYLDGDIIAVDSLEPLWATELGDHYLGAVTNVFQEHDARRPAELGLPPGQPYFNSGVLLMNLEQMRRDRCTERLLAYSVENSELLAWPDQDALNVVLGDRRLALHPRWNLMNSILLFPWSADVFGAEAVAEARADPAIRHFEGPSANKPWHASCDRGMRELYLAHRRGTPWPEVELEGAEPRGVRGWMRGLRGHARA